MPDGQDPHILAFHDGSRLADLAVRQAAELALGWDAALTILTVARLESVPRVGRRCCGVGPACWNGIVRDVAAEHLARAARAADFPDAELVMQAGSSVAETVAKEAGARHCTLVVVPAARMRLRSRTSLQRALQRRLTAPVVNARALPGWPPRARPA